MYVNVISIAQGYFKFLYLYIHVMIKVKKRFYNCCCLCFLPGTEDYKTCESIKFTKQQLVYSVTLCIIHLQ